MNPLTQNSNYLPFHLLDSISENISELLNSFPFGGKNISFKRDIIFSSFSFVEIRSVLKFLI